MKKILIIYAVIAFVLNFIWEISQTGLYKSPFNGAADFVFVYSKATLGDVAILLIIYLVISLVYRNKGWIKEHKNGAYLLASLFGFLIAVAIEKYALSTGRWSYSELMPIIPYVKVGLTPVLQLVIIAPVTVLFTRYGFNKCFHFNE